MLKTEKVGRDRASMYLLSLLIVMLLSFCLVRGCPLGGMTGGGLLPTSTGMVKASSRIELSDWLNHDFSLSGVTGEDGDFRGDEELLVTMLITESESIPSI